jgi:hypothetical protein
MQHGMELAHTETNFAGFSCRTKVCTRPGLRQAAQGLGDDAFAFVVDEVNTDEILGFPDVAAILCVLQTPCDVRTRAQSWQLLGID